MEIEDATTHWHVCWFGWEFTFSSPGTDENDNGSDPMPDEQMIVVSTTDQPVIAASQSVDVCSSMTDAPADRFVVLLAFTVHQSAVPAVGHQLCDTARHERSGAQLI